ncbi:AfsR/SARP family transcriptional regulator [Nonomuraea montanisoli]|nr:AfsR/SARP family transcriptional regulator [Nonomuraea montanisoli]
MLQLHILGPLQVTLGGRPVELGPARQRAVLARLVAEGGQVVSTDRFIEDLWQGQPPPKALAALQVYISNLRRLLEPDRPPRAPATVIVSTPPGYRLRLPEEAVDAWRLPRLVETAGTALQRGAAADAHRLLDGALGWWSGTAYGEFADGWAAAEAGRLAELRLIAAEYRAEAALMLGRHVDAVPELRRHAEAHPLRENAVGLLALALYRSGSQAEALAVLRRARGHLAEELGVDPGPALRALEQDILRQSPSLRPPSANGGSSPQAGVVQAVGGFRGSGGGETGRREDAPGEHQEGSHRSGREYGSTAVQEQRPAGRGRGLVGREREHAGQERGLADPERGLANPEPELAAPGPELAERGPELAERGPELAERGRELVGRGRELAALREEAGRPGRRMVWLAGEPGAGKSALAEAFAAELAGRGRRVALGRCPEIDGDAPPAWAWSEIVRDLAAARPPGDGTRTVRPPGDGPGTVQPPGSGTGAAAPPGDGTRTATPSEDGARLTPPSGGGRGTPPPSGDGRGTAPPSGDEDGLAPLLRDGVAIPNQFRLARAVAGYLAACAPLLVVLDDVHRADGETLHLLRHLPDAADLLVVATYRPAEVTEDLAATLAALAGAGRHVDLGGLEEAAVAALLRRHSGRDLDPADVRAVAERTQGNPLFVCETARLISSEGAGAARALPPGVRDLIRRRVARLPATARTVLRNAAVVGREADVEVLIALHDGDEDTVFDGLEAGVITGLLTEPGPGRVRFAHVLVREVLYEDTARIRRTRLHGRVVAALERVRPGDVAALAHHALEAASPDAVRYARAAALQASGLHAHREAAALWRAALEFATTDGTRLELLCGLVSALGHAGDVIGALAARTAAVETAHTIGRHAAGTAHGEATHAISRHAAGAAHAIGRGAATGGPSPLQRALTSYDAPVIWTIQVDARLDEEFVAALERELAAGPGDEARCRLLATLVFAMEGHDDARVDAAGAEAVALARRAGRPDLLCLALNARYFALLAPERRAELEAVGAELLELGRAHRLVGYLTLGHGALLMAALGRNDLEAAARHADRGVEVSTSGQLGLSLAILTLFGGLRKLVEGDYDAAEAVYDGLARQMAERGAVNAEAMGMVGRFVVRLARGDVRASVPELALLAERVPNEATRELYAGALAASGDLAAARRVWRPRVAHPRDYYWLLWETLHAQTAVALGHREAAERCYRNLLPWDGELGGMHSGSVTLGPVALVLGDLAGLLGLGPDTARDHYARAVAVAEGVGAPRWARQARERFEGLP